MNHPTPDADKDNTPATPAVAPAAAPLPRRRSALTQQVLEQHFAHDAGERDQLLRKGAHWFYWVAALSLINSLIGIFGGGVTFLAGLAVSQIVDAVAAGFGLVEFYYTIPIDLVIAFFVCGFGYLATHGSRKALIAGMVLYALDGAIFLYCGSWAPALFHGFVLYQMWSGWHAQKRLDELRQWDADIASRETAAGRLVRRGPIS